MARGRPKKYSDNELKMWCVKSDWCMDAVAYSLGVSRASIRYRAKRMGILDQFKARKYKKKIPPSLEILLDYQGLIKMEELGEKYFIERTTIKQRMWRAIDYIWDRKVPDIKVRPQFWAMRKLPRPHQPSWIKIYWLFIENEWDLAGHTPRWYVEQTGLRIGTVKACLDNVRHPQDSPARRPDGTIKKTGRRAIGC